MALVDRTSIGRYGMAAIAAGVFTALAVASSGPAWGQDTGDEAGAPAASRGGDDGSSRQMQMMMDARQRWQRRGPAHGPWFSAGQGCLHHDRSPRCRRRNRGPRHQQPRPDRGRVHRCRRDDPRFSAGRRRFHPDRSPGCRGPGPEPWPSASTTVVRSWASTSMPKEHPWFPAGQGPWARRDRASSPPSISGWRWPVTDRRRHQRPRPDRGRLPRCRRQGAMASCGTRAVAPGGTRASSPPSISPAPRAPGPRHQQPRPDRRRLNRLRRHRMHGFLLDDGEFITIDHPDATSEIDGARNRPLRPQRPWPDRGPIFRLTLPRFPAGRRHLHHDR